MTTRTILIRVTVPDSYDDEPDDMVFDDFADAVIQDPWREAMELVQDEQEEEMKVHRTNAYAAAAAAGCAPHDVPRRIAELEAAEAELRWVDEQLASIRAAVRSRTVMTFAVLSGLMDMVHNRKGMDLPKTEEEEE